MSGKLQEISLNIALVDDDEDMTSLTKFFLEKKGHVVNDFQSPGEAYEKISSGLLTDILITDYVMPGMDGNELRIRLEEDKHVFSTMLMTSQIRPPGYDSFSVYILKPFRLTDFSGAVQYGVATRKTVLIIGNEKQLKSSKAVLHNFENPVLFSVPEEAIQGEFNENGDIGLVICHELPTSTPCTPCKFAERMKRHHEAPFVYISDSYDRATMPEINHVMKLPIEKRLPELIRSFYNVKGIQEYSLSPFL